MSHTRSASSWDGEGLWRWHYVDHQTLAWSAGRVEFNGVRATVFEDDTPYREFELHREPAEPETLDRERYFDLFTLSASLSAEDVAEWHAFKSAR